MKQIAIIGYGHMGKALEEGLLKSGLKREQIIVSNSSRENRKTVEKSDWIFITVKPFVAKTVLGQLQDVLADKIIISSVAGLSLEKIASLTGKQQKALRIMPNLPVAYNEGVIGFFANQYVSPIERKELLGVLTDLGTVVKCKVENELEAITVLAGCGPALVAYFINMLNTSGMAFRLAKNTSEVIALQTIIGTLKWLEETDQTAENLQFSVATKGGVTEEIINGLNENQIPEQFVASLEKGYDKIKKLKEEL
jgi:pyrroline-5-carboxylate reductase